MSWTAITADDLRDAKLSELVDALQTAALGAGQGDPTPRVISGVIERIRRKVGSHRLNRVDADPDTIPAGCKSMAVAFVLAELKSRLEIPLTDDERSAIERHERDLSAIASGKESIDQPDTPVTAPVESGSAVQIVNPGSGLGRDSLAGL